MVTLTSQPWATATGFNCVCIEQSRRENGDLHSQSQKGHEDLEEEAKLHSGQYGTWRGKSKSVNWPELRGVEYPCFEQCCSLPFSPNSSNDDTDFVGSHHI
jgi:hypothetical protein